MEEEAPRHYIDLDVYPDSLISFLQNDWKTVTMQIPEDSLKAYGIVPWHLSTMYYYLRNAFLEKNPGKILKLSAEIGHYIADANVPLHTTENYNGQLTDQHGIHGLWESRLPELYFSEYSFFVGKAEFIDDPLWEAWQAVMNSHSAMDSVLQFEKLVSAHISEDKKYTYEHRGNNMVKAYSREFCKEYHRRLSGMVERRMQAAVKMIGDFWYSAWVHAGQPDLTEFESFEFSENDRATQRDERVRWRFKLFKAREENDSGNN